MEEKPIEPLLEEVAKIEGELLIAEEKLDTYLKLAKQFPEDANLHFIIGVYSYGQSKLELFCDHSKKAHILNPKIPEYKLNAGLAIYAEGNLKQAKRILEEIDDSELEPLAKLYKCIVLERLYLDSDPEKSAHYRSIYEEIVESFKATTYFKENFLANLKVLDEMASAR